MSWRLGPTIGQQLLQRAVRSQLTLTLDESDRIASRLLWLDLVFTPSGVSE
jgi:hypothetical protein